jgi:hypothetical protein
MAIKFVDKPPEAGPQPARKPAKALVQAPRDEAEAAETEANAPVAKRRGRPAKAATAKEDAKTAKPAKSKWKRG